MNSSLARLGPTSRARRCVPPPPGMMPSRISGWPNTARSPARSGSRRRAPARSRRRGRTRTPPRSPCEGSPRPHRARRGSTAVIRAPPPSAPPNSEMSAPAAKIRSPPVITTAPGGIAVQARPRSRAAGRATPARALTLPLSSVTTATPSSRRSSVTNGSSAHAPDGIMRRADAVQHGVGGRPRIGLVARSLAGGGDPTARRCRSGGPAARGAVGDDLAQLLPARKAARARVGRWPRRDLAVGVDRPPRAVDAIPGRPTVGTIGGRQLSWPSSDRSSICSRSRRVSSTPGRSALLITNTSAISISPALLACTLSPHPG